MHIYPTNPRYFVWRGQPCVLVGGGEHYGAIMNLEFDMSRYLDAMSQAGLNLTRVFSGSYVEALGSFGIIDNTLAPHPDAYVAPWVRDEQGRYDLARINPVWIQRLNAFVAAAAQRDIVVELTLFCFWYDQADWERSPMHPTQSRQAVGPYERARVYEADSALLPYMRRLVQVAATELKKYDNVYIEICNEPYSRHDHTMDMAWHEQMIEAIVAVAPELPIAINVANRTQKLLYVPAHVSVVNFHYAIPSAARENWHLGVIIGDDETGFRGNSARPYRSEAWSFLLAGGGIFSHLDYSFTVTHPDGSAVPDPRTPGYGGADLRAQMAFLRNTLERVAVWDMRPCNEIIAWYAGDSDVQLLAVPGERYIGYIPQNVPQQSLMLGIPAGRYTVEWLYPASCVTQTAATIEHRGGFVRIDTPWHADDLGFVLVRVR